MMWFSRSSSTFLAVFALCTTSVLTVPTVEVNRVHESRPHPPSGWTRQEGLLKTTVLPFRIALTQSNLHQLDDLLMSVSHPESEQYGQHWTIDQVAKTFAPSQESVDAVGSWLSSHGIGVERTSRSRSLGWLHFNATIEEAENLLKAEYSAWKHESGGIHVACNKYHVPQNIAEHIDFITPTIHFDAKIGHMAPGNGVERRAPPAPQSNAVYPKKTVVVGESYPSLQTIYSELANCSQYIVPDCLRALYLIPPVSTNIQTNPFGIVEYTPQAYLQSDLNIFFDNYSPNQRQRTPLEHDIDGGFQQMTISPDYNSEPELDLEYGMTLVNPIQVTLYQAGDLYEGASFNNFLDAIDNSGYCTFEGGDDPTQDSVYPDPDPAGYEGPQNCGTFAATKVISTSYGYNEHDLSVFYTARQCQEYAKLGLLGTSILYSSGDYGVAGNGGQCINPDGSYNDGTSGRFNPSFPGTCPYVTSVGATQVIPGANVVKDLATGVQPEEACETVIYSGGGFSDYFSMPSYQSAAVSNYFKKYNPPYTSAQYNNSRTSRSIPDVSANGANYITVIDGDLYLVYGTSASSPTFASILTIVNEYRAAIGKGSVGFVNPTLYANPQVLNDITKGNNPGCGTNGFSAVPGWDPVTGLGTPNAAKMLALFLLLP